MQFYFAEYSAGNQVSETASATICMFNMAQYKDFDITVRCSSSSGFEYKVYGSPIGNSGLAFLVTGASAVTDFAKACGTIVSTVRNSYMSTYWIEAQATAAAREVSASNIQVIVTALKE